MRFVENKNWLPRSGTGLGLKRPFIRDILASPPQSIDFYEIAPENWMMMGGRFGDQFSEITNRFPVIAHGLSLSIGSQDSLDIEFITKIKHFLSQHKIPLYSEHLSYCSHKGHLYDLMPLPFTEEAVDYVATRIRTVQDILEQTIAIENISYYASPGKEMSELEFFKAVVERSDCLILLDINNIYVNSTNHGYDAEAFLKSIPSERIAYGHMAGHFKHSDDFLIDTHGAPIVDPVWSLLKTAYLYHGIFPTLLERDFNIPQLDELIAEVDQIKMIQQATDLASHKQVA